MTFSTGPATLLISCVRKIHLDGEFPTAPTPLFETTIAHPWLPRSGFFYLTFVRLEPPGQLSRASTPSLYPLICPATHTRAIYSIVATHQQITPATRRHTATTKRYAFGDENILRPNRHGSMMPARERFTTIPQLIVTRRRLQVNSLNAISDFQICSCAANQCSVNTSPTNRRYHACGRKVGPTTNFSITNEMVSLKTPKP